MQGSLVSCYAQTVIEQGPQEKVGDVVQEAEEVKKEVQIQQKALELEKKNAEIKLMEAEAAKKEAETIKDVTKSKKEVKEAALTAKQKEEEAKAALGKVKITEEKLKVAQERAEIAEAKIKITQSLIIRKVIQTFVVILIGYVLIFIFVGIVNRRIQNVRVKHIVRKNIIYLLNILILLYIIFIWLRNINSITIFLSVIGAGIALALQEVILCMAGWFLIMVRRPFEVGDRIELGGVKGDVIDIRLFQVSLLEIGNWVGADQSTGRIVNVPNSEIFKRENYNYSRGFEFIWNEIKVLVTFESDWKRAEEIMIHHAVKEAKGMEEIVKKKITQMTRHYMIYYEKLTPIVYIDIKDSGVELSLRYLTEARKRRATHDVLCRAILDDFDKEDKVNFAYTTYRIVK
ncbi:MAG: mechanosensitive ion channel [Candidatus Omnitrophota bacterium]|nr:MAG: mechanosensitive ion channel [Candidatus Omnitrophota bacterium]